jgi:hypothetical protein
MGPQRRLSAHVLISLIRYSFSSDSEAGTVFIDDQRILTRGRKVLKKHGTRIQPGKQKAYTGRNTYY